MNNFQSSIYKSCNHIPVWPGNGTFYCLSCGQILAPDEISAREDTLEQIPPQRCEIGLDCGLPRCWNTASWRFNGCAMCDMGIQGMATMNSENAVALAPALGAIQAAIGANNLIGLLGALEQIACGICDALADADIPVTEQTRFDYYDAVHAMVLHPCTRVTLLVCDPGNHWHVGTTLKQSDATPVAQSQKGV